MSEKPPFIPPKDIELIIDEGDFEDDEGDFEEEKIEMPELMPRAFTKVWQEILRLIDDLAILEEATELNEEAEKIPVLMSPWKKFARKVEELVQRKTAKMPAVLAYAFKAPYLPTPFTTKQKEAIDNAKVFTREKLIPEEIKKFYQIGNRRIPAVLKQATAAVKSHITALEKFSASRKRETKIEPKKESEKYFDDKAFKARELKESFWPGSVVPLPPPPPTGE